ncbi:MAG TPA: type IV pilin protein [Steroidobacteraceae bacterium]|nr:type IV pilin protein [Steroidobacteraceae bacterium]
MSKLSGSRKRHAMGFTLIELMVTVAILAILTTIAVTSYSSSVLKSRRTEAKSALLDLAGREEKLFSTTNAYSNLEAFVGYAAAGATTVMTNMAFGNNYYTLTAQVPDPNQAGNAASYLLTATPVGNQANDSLCGSFSVNQLGVQTVTGTATAATCWGD